MTPAVSARAALDARIAAALRPETGPAASGIPVVTGADETSEVTPGQRRVYLESTLDPDIASTYHVSLIRDLHGPLDVARLETAVVSLARRHRVLRSVIREGRQGLRSVALAPDSVVLQRRIATVESIDATIRELVDRPFDLAADVPMRATLIDMTADQHALVLVFHHIAVDHASLELLDAELATAYAGERTAADDSAPRPQYGDYAAWLGQARQLARTEADVSWWREHLASPPGPVVIGTDLTAPAHPTFGAGVVPVVFPPELVATIERRASESSLSATMILVAAWRVLVSRLSGATDFAIAVPASLRSHPDTAEMVGFFVNTVVVRCPIEPAESVAALLDRERAALLDAMSHVEAGFERVVDVVAPQRTFGVNPLATTLVNILREEPASPAWGALSGAPREAATDYAVFDLSLDVLVGSRGYAAELTYRTDRYTREEAERWAAWYPELVAALLADLDAPVASVRIAAADRLGLDLTAQSADRLPIRDLTGAPTLPGSVGRLDTGERARRRADGRLDMLPETIAVGEVAVGAATRTPPTSEAELLVAEIWSEVLDRVDLAREDNFFELGGQSLAGTQVALALRESLDTQIPVRLLFDHPGLADFAAAIERFLEEEPV